MLETLMVWLCLLCSLVTMKEEGLRPFCVWPSPDVWAKCMFSGLSVFPRYLIHLTLYPGMSAVSLQPEWSCCTWVHRVHLTKFCLRNAIRTTSAPKHDYNSDNSIQSQMNWEEMTPHYTTKYIEFSHEVHEHWVCQWGFFFFSNKILNHSKFIFINEKNHLAYEF